MPRKSKRNKAQDYTVVDGVQGLNALEIALEIEKKVLKNVR